jgi:histidinol-phosphate phosphatase family protein
MQAVIMAGGKGTRLASVTKNIPKPMVPINGKPLLEYQIDNLKQSGVDNAIFVVGYLGDVIKDYFGNGEKFGVKISYFMEETPLGTAGALAELKDQLEENFILLFGDLFVNVNFDRFMQFHADKEALVTLFAHPNSHPYDSDIVIANKDGRVTGWSYKNTERSIDYPNLTNAGLYVMNRNIADVVQSVQEKKDTKKVDLEKDIITQMIGTGKIFAYHSTEYVKDIGTPERLKKAEQDIGKEIPEKRNLRNKQEAIFLDRDGTINQYVGFLRSVDQMQLEPMAAEAIRLINESEYLAIVITNQPVVARGEVGFDELDAIHNRMYTLLGKEGAYVDGLYFCPHHPDKGFEGEIPELKIDCNCRKPKTGMLKKAVGDFNIDLTGSWFVGDTNIDVQTGINAGTHTVLLKSGDPDKKGNRYPVKANFTARNLLDAVRQIVKE